MPKVDDSALMRARYRLAQRPGPFEREYELGPFKHPQRHPSRKRLAALPEVLPVPPATRQPSLAAVRRSLAARADEQARFPWGITRLAGHGTPGTAPIPLAAVYAKLKPDYVRVWKRLVSLRKPNGLVWPTMKWVAKETGVRYERLEYAMRRLRDIGLVEIAPKVWPENPADVRIQANAWYVLGQIDDYSDSIVLPAANAARFAAANTRGGLRSNPAPKRGIEVAAAGAPFLATAALYMPAEIVRAANAPAIASEHSMVESHFDGIAAESGEGGSADPPANRGAVGQIGGHSKTLLNFPSTPTLAPAGLGRSWKERLASRTHAGASARACARRPDSSATFSFRNANKRLNIHLPIGIGVGRRSELGGSPSGALMPVMEAAGMLALFDAVEAQIEEEDIFARISRSVGGPAPVRPFSPPPAPRVISQPITPRLKARPLALRQVSTALSGVCAQCQQRAEKHCTGHSEAEVERMVAARHAFGADCALRYLLPPPPEDVFGDTDQWPALPALPERYPTVATVGRCDWDEAEGGYSELVPTCDGLPEMRRDDFELWWRMAQKRGAVPAAPDMTTVHFPQPPLMPPRLPDTRAADAADIRLLTSLWATALRSRYGQEVHGGANRIRGKLLDAAAKLREYQILPGAWAAWSADCWKRCRAQGESGYQGAPSLTWVWSVNRMEDRRTWFGHEWRMPNTAFPNPKRGAYLERLSIFKERAWYLVRKERQGDVEARLVALRAKAFPGGRAAAQAAAAAIAEHTARTQGTLDQMAAEGKCIW